MNQYDIKAKICSIHEELKQKSKTVRFMPMEDIIAIVEELQDVLQLNSMSEWILVSERLPIEHKSIFARFKGTDMWRDSMYETVSDTVLTTCVCKDGSTVVVEGRMYDGELKPCQKWMKDFSIIAWMPFPEPMKEDNTTNEKEE